MRRQCIVGRTCQQANHGAWQCWAVSRSHAEEEASPCVTGACVRQLCSYSRIMNPTNAVFEERVAALEGPCPSQFPGTHSSTRPPHSALLFDFTRPYT